MKTTLLFVSVLIAATFTASAQYNNDNLKMTTNEQSVERYTFEKLRIYPIRANDAFREAHRSIGDYTNLKEAIEGKDIKVSEVSESGTVNTLMAENTSTDSIYIMAGEVVKGGKQDRVIAQDIIIAPGETVNLSAFCVERGRWSHKGSGGNFDGYFNVSSKAVRKAAVLDKNQGKVWEDVAKTTASNQATSGSGTYTELANSKEYQDELKDYIKKFESAWNADSKVIGVVAVTGNEVIGCDLFATHDLFVNAYNNLLHSYITEAITNGKEVAMNHNNVQKYLDDFLADESKQDEALEGKGMIYKHGKSKLHLSKF